MENQAVSLDLIKSLGMGDDAEPLQLPSGKCALWHMCATNP